MKSALNRVLILAQECRGKMVQNRTGIMDLQNKNNILVAKQVSYKILIPMSSIFVLGKKRPKNEGPDQAINLQTPPGGTPGGTPGGPGAWRGPRRGPPLISGNKLSYIPVSKRGIPLVGEFIYTNYLNTDNIYM